nr:6438_t:CDS:2 [Entrophospora candida]
MHIDDSERLSKALSIPFDQMVKNEIENIWMIDQALVIDKLIKDLLAILSEKYEIVMVMARNLSDHRKEASSRLLDT